MRNGSPFGKDPEPFEHGERVLKLLEGVRGDVHHDRDDVGAAQKVRHPGIYVVSRDGRSVHQLKLNIFVRRHSRAGFERRVREFGHLRVCVGEGGHEGGLSHVGGSDDEDLGGSLLFHRAGEVAFRRALLLLRFQLHTSDSLPEVSPQLVRTLVFGHYGEHLLQEFHLVLSGFRFAKPLLGIEVCGRQIGGHFHLLFS